jgi:hypothetical protein
MQLDDPLQCSKQPAITHCPESHELIQYSHTPCFFNVCSNITFPITGMNPKWFMPKYYGDIMSVLQYSKLLNKFNWNILLGVTEKAISAKPNFTNSLSTGLLYMTWNTNLTNNCNFYLLLVCVNLITYSGKLYMHLSTDLTLWLEILVCISTIKV